MAGRLAGQLFADQGAEVFLARSGPSDLDDTYFDRGKVVLPSGALSDTSSADVIIVDGDAPVRRLPHQIVLRITAALPGDEMYGDLPADAHEDLLSALVGFYTDMSLTGPLLGNPVIYMPLPLCSVLCGRQRRRGRRRLPFRSDPHRARPGHHRLADRRRPVGHRRSQPADRRAAATLHAGGDHRDRGTRRGGSRRTEGDGRPGGRRRQVPQLVRNAVRAAGRRTLSQQGRQVVPGAHRRQPPPDREQHAQLRPVRRDPEARAS